MSDTLPHLYKFAAQLADYYLATFDSPAERRKKVLVLLLNLLTRICENHFCMTRPEYEVALLARHVLRKLAHRPVGRDDAILLRDLFHSYLGKRVVSPEGWDRAYGIAAALNGSDLPLVRNSPSL